MYYSYFSVIVNYWYIIISRGNLDIVVIGIGTVFCTVHTSTVHSTCTCTCTCTVLWTYDYVHTTCIHSSMYSTHGNIPDYMVVIGAGTTCICKHVTMYNVHVCACT